MSNLSILLEGLEEILQADLDFISDIISFIYDNKLLLLIFTVPVVMISVKVLRKLLKL